MLKSWRSNFLPLILFLGILAFPFQKGWTDGPVDRLSFSSLLNTDVFEAGVTTNNVTFDFFINTFHEVKVGTTVVDLEAPDAGEVVTLELIDTNGDS
ncbi:hypothetical protein BVX98_01445, partial [bacterium F11]